MQAKIDKNLCDHCHMCVGLSGAFSVGLEDVVVVTEDINKDEEDNVKEASERCPTSAIRITE